MKDPIFKAQPRLERYFKTSDGVAFFTEHDAKTYAAKLKDKTVTEVIKNASSTAKEKQTASDKKELTANQKAKLRIGAIEKMGTIEAVENALAKETAKTVIAAGKKRIEALEKENNTTDADIEDKQEDDTNVSNATMEELMLYVNDNEVPLNGASSIEDIRTAVRAYLDDPNKKTVPFKEDLNEN